jgi:hypothetical protein
LGFALGKRPSTTRPLRRRGSTPDIQWDTGVLLFRRSNTHGQIVMEGVKTGGEERVQAPAELLAVCWHVETQLRSPAQQESDLLFPAVHGGFRTRNVLDKPFRGVAGAIGLGKRITPRAPAEIDTGLPRTPQHSSCGRLPARAPSTFEQPTSVVLKGPSAKPEPHRLPAHLSAIRPERVIKAGCARGTAS